jgi:hypothetical protein
MKAIATVSMVVGAGLSHLKFQMNIALVIDAIFLSAIVFVLTRKSKLSLF